MNNDRIFWMLVFVMASLGALIVCYMLIRHIITSRNFILVETLLIAIMFVMGLCFKDTFEE